MEVFVNVLVISKAPGLGEKEINDISVEVFDLGLQTVNIRHLLFPGYDICIWFLMDLLMDSS